MDVLLAIFRSLSDASRLRILLLLRRMELSVGEIAAVLGQSQPRVSRHIRILADAGVVDRAKEGAWVFVRLGKAAISGPALAAIDALGGSDLAAADLERLTAVRAERAAAADAWFAAHADDWDKERSLAAAEADVEAAIIAALGGHSLGALIDVGTGTGRMIELLGPRARSALGIDRSPEMLRLARGRIESSGLVHAQVRAGDMYALPGSDASADTVVVHQVLHFADDPGAVVREAARVLAPGGRLLVVDLMPHDREDLRTTRRHVRLGFADEAVTGWMAAAGLSASVVAQLPSMDGLGVSLWLGQQPANAERRAA
ncbi:metalloregulator ArsR/SmtB family transcription factor [Sandarakinorhabdus sp.]|uniref:ArsR/SmtB family transcription factor n=1 Tax=Sandarakinorhabdus sp. TaxID=1916663 RepID=UPI00286EA55E|nr:metalloregulator ArsR/SmtB family transcription factor [Sandarakinorhabdus sp.]